MEAELKRQEDISRFERFNKWCNQMGIIAPKLEYPAFFKGGLCEGKNPNKKWLLNKLLKILQTKIKITPLKYW